MRRSYLPSELQIQVKFVCIRVWPLVSCLLFQINILKVYLWCYFKDRVSDINMLSMIMILIAFNIKFQCQYFLLILLVRSLLESLLAFFFTYQRFSLAKLVSFYRLYILLNSLLKASVQAKEKNIGDLFVYVKRTVITLKTIRSALLKSQFL